MAIKKKISITLIIFSISIISIIAFVIVPIFQKINDNAEKIISQKQKMALLEAEDVNLKENESFQEQSKQLMEQVDKLFVNLDIPLEFINFLEKTSEECQLKIEILPNFEKKTEKGSWPYSIFQITSTGSFSNFLNFVEKLNNSDYLIEMQNINVSKTGSSEANIRAVFMIKVFVE